VFLDKDGKEYYRHLGFFPKEEIIKVLQLKGIE
jgi:thioredoxin 1